MTTTSARFQQAHNNASYWLTSSDTLLAGEFAFSIDDRVLKIGDGSNNWNSSSAITLTSSLGSGILDVTTTPSPVEGSILLYYGSSYKWFFGRKFTNVNLNQTYDYNLQNLDDVNISGVTSDQIFIWDNTNNFWYNADVEVGYIDNLTPPATASSTGELGDIRYDGSYLYVCVATNTWKRANLVTW